MSSRRFSRAFLRVADDTSQARFGASAQLALHCRVDTWRAGPNGPSLSANPKYRESAGGGCGRGITPRRRYALAAHDDANT